MSDNSRTLVSLLAVCSLLLFLVGCGDSQLETQKKSAQAQVNRWADKLDSQTTDTGVYIQPEKPELPEKDPWGASLVVTYSQGGTAETLVVRSFGPDGVSHTEDDISAQRVAVNLKGIGQGIKKNVAETAKETAKGAVRGIIQGTKEGLKDAFKKKDKGEEPSEEPNDDEEK